MPVARFQMPDGRVARFEVPEGTTPEQAQSMMEAHFAAQPEPVSRGVTPVEKPRTLPDISKLGVTSTGTPTATFGAEALQGPVTMPGAIATGLATGAQRGVVGVAELGARAVGAEDLQRTAQAIREASRLGMEPYKEAYPISAGAAEFAGELAAPLAAISKTGQAIRAAGAIAPSVARVTAPLATAIETGGFRTGLTPGAANVLAKAAGGALGSAGTTAILEGNLENVLPSAGFGAAVPIALPALAKLGYEGVSRGIDYAIGMAPKVRAGEIARRIAGPELEAIKAATVAAPELSAGQAAAGVNRAAWQSLAEDAAKKDPLEFVRVLKESQGADQLNELARLAGGPTQTASLQAQKAAKNALNQTVGAVMETELKAAGEAGKFFRQAVPKMQQKYESMVDALRQTGQLYAYENQARQALRSKLESPTPGWVSANTIEQLEQNTLKARSAVEEMNAMKWQRQDEGEFLRRQVDSLAAHGLKPIDTTGIVSSISAKLQNPKIGVSDENKKVLTAVADKILEWTAKGEGYIDPMALHEIRKNTVNEVINKELAGADPNYIRRQAAKVLTEIKPLIDDAIEQAGGDRWKKALDAYSKLTERNVARKEFAAEAMKLYQSSPQKFVELIEGQNPALVEDIFGVGNIDVKKAMGGQYGALKNVSDQVKRDLRMSELATQGRALAAEELSKEAMRFRLPGLLSPKVTAANKMLDVFESNLNQKTKNALIEGMRTGKSANELLNTLPASERYKVLQALPDFAKKFATPSTTATIGQSQAQGTQ